VTKYKARAYRPYVERHERVTSTPFHAQLFAALRNARPIRATAPIRPTKEARQLIGAAIDGFKQAFGCHPATLTPLYRRKRLIGIECRGAIIDQVWMTTEAEAA
jgi:hypothetical protein